MGAWTSLVAVHDNEADFESTIGNAGHLKTSPALTQLAAVPLELAASVVALSPPSPREPNPPGPSDAYVAEALCLIERAFVECWNNPTTRTNMTAYTYVYNLCRYKGKRGKEIKDKVFVKYRQEVHHCVQLVRDSLLALVEHPHGLEDKVAWPELARTWQRLQRHMRLLQTAFGYLDRYHVPELKLLSLTETRLDLLREAGVCELGEKVWHSLAVQIREGQVKVGATAVGELITAWRGFGFAAGMEMPDDVAAEVLREHLVSACSVHCARASVLQPPLLRLIFDHLSEHDLYHTYGVGGL